MEEQNPELLLRKHLLEWKEQLAKEVGTEPQCPFCAQPRVRRSDYVRCRNCGINWLDEERHLPEYLNRNPASVRALMGAGAAKPATTSAEAVKN